MRDKLEKFGYMVLGAIIALCGYVLGTMNSGSVDAQLEIPVVDKIVCRQLEVVNSQGKTLVRVGEELRDGGTSVLRVYDGIQQGSTVDLLTMTDGGGFVMVRGKDGEPGVTLYTHTDGGDVKIFEKGGKTVAELSSNTNGGSLMIGAKDGELGVALGISPTGGYVGVLDQFGNPKASLP